MTPPPSSSNPIAIYYEHPEWFKPLFAELERRGAPYEKLHAQRHSFDPAESETPYRLIVNRMSPSAYTRGHAHAIPYTLHYLAHLQDIGARVFNGFDAYRYEFSKVRQIGLLHRLGLPYPRARAINHPSQAPSAAEGLRYPIIVKPNIGGSGAGMRRFDTPEVLTEAVEQNQLELGPDHTALVQEYLKPKNARIVRVETLAGRFLYAIRLRLLTPDSFNLCPADYCKPGETPTDSEPVVEAYTPPQDVIQAVERIAQAAQLDTGGVEYLVNETDDQVHFYDVNAMSNFVANAEEVIGFNPFRNLVDELLARAEEREPVLG